MRYKCGLRTFGGVACKLRVEYPGAIYVKSGRDYVHLNPARARLLNPTQALRDSRWSSSPEYLKRAGERWPFTAQKVVIAVRLRAETAVTVQWIAERLQMRAPGYVHHLLFRRRKAKGARVVNIKN